MPRKNFKVIFVALAFRNHEDLKTLLDTIGTQIKQPHKSIVVNSYYDDSTMEKIKKISLENDCDFVNVENKGYGYGNNVGIAYALENYTFDFLFVSNPDTVITSFPEVLATDTSAIIAPEIRTLSGKMQNPMLPSRCELSAWLINRGFVRNNRILTAIGIGINKIVRSFFLTTRSQQKAKIYQPHGSFIGFGDKALRRLKPPVFDEQIFLFAEEGLLAWRALKEGVNVFYEPQIKITHKQDGSMSFLESTNELLKQSNIYVYEKTHSRSKTCRL